MCLTKLLDTLVKRSFQVILSICRNFTVARNGISTKSRKTSRRIIYFRARHVKHIIF